MLVAVSPVATKEMSFSLADAEIEETTPVEQSTYSQIVKSSLLVGGSSVLNIVFGIVRTKAMAVLLGPSGFALFGVYGSITDLTQSIAGMGVNSSGVRQIADAAGTNNQQRIAQTAYVLRRASLVLGILGALFLAAFSRQFSVLTFGNDRHALAIALLSITVLFRLVSAGQASLIQGLRRMSDLAKINVFGALFGTVISIPVVYLFGERGIVPSLIAVAGVTIATSWWYSRTLSSHMPSMTISQLVRETSPLLRLGMAFMATGLMTMGSGYVVRIIVLRTLGFEATGLYQSAWALGGLYVSFILQAMGADFYPRLVASAANNFACNRMVNEQAQVGLLLAGPGAIGTLTFAPLVIALFYSAKFYAAIGILRWICLGTTLQVITWPMGFISLAKGRSSVFFWSDFAWTAVYLGLAWTCVRLFGLNGIGIAFLGSYICHALITYPIARWLSGFRWSHENRRIGLAFGLLISLVFCAFIFLSNTVAETIGVAATILSSAYSLRKLSRLFSFADFPAPLRTVLLRFRLAPSN